MPWNAAIPHTNMMVHPGQGVEHLPESVNNGSQRWSDLCCTRRWWYSAPVKLLLRAFLPCFAVLCACSSVNRVPHPDGTLQRYIEHVEQGELDEAYELLSEAERQRVSLEEFQRAARENPEELASQVRELRRQMADPIPVRAEVRLESGDVATFELYEGRWRIAEGAAGAVSLTSPVQTLRALRRALQRRSYRGVLRVLSREARAQVEDEVVRIIEGIEDEESLTIEITGNRARIVYDDTHFLELQREDGEWMIVDMN